MAREAAVLPVDSLREQLEELECLDPTMNILEQQAKLKKEAREAKAERLLAKGLLHASTYFRILSLLVIM